MTSAKSSSGINAQRQFHSVRTQDRKTLDALLYRIRELLHGMPQRTPCLQYGTVTANLVRGFVQHEDFQCMIPLSVCFACSEKPPFGDAGLRFRYALIHEEDGQQERAAAICEELISKNPKFTEAFA